MTRDLPHPPASSASGGASRSPGGLPRRTMGGQVADDLRRQIMAGELPEGHQLRQEQLAAAFGISKVPVREALNQLEAEGLVVQHFHRGAVVAGLSLDQIMQTFELRAQIEVWLMGLAMVNAGPADVQAAALRAQDLAESTELTALPDMNWRFHEALYAPARKDHVLDFVRKLHGQVERFVRMQVRLAVRMDQVVAEHAQILDLYTRQDVGAQLALRQHIMGSAERLADRLEEIRQGSKDGAAASKA